MSDYLILLLLPIKYITQLLNRTNPVLTGFFNFLLYFFELWTVCAKN